MDRRSFFARIIAAVAGLFGLSSVAKAEEKRIPGKGLQIFPSGSTTVFFPKGNLVHCFHVLAQDGTEFVYTGKSLWKREGIGYWTTASRWTRTIDRLTVDAEFSGAEQAMSVLREYDDRHKPKQEDVDFVKLMNARH